jgi:serine/threonine protein kinase
MEAYTLWWNGKILQKMLGYNTKYSPIMDNWTLLWQGGLDMEGQTWLVAFKINCVKLAWEFINIMDIIHQFGILHNDLSKDNIMLHFLLNKLDVYIGVCNWDETGCLQEVTPSLYGFAK